MPIVDLHGGPLALQLAGPESGDFSSGAALNVDLADVSMTAEASASAGTDEGHSDFWHKQRAQVEAHLSGPAGSNISAQGADEFSYTYRDPASVGDPGTATHLIGTENRSVSLSGSVPLAGGARLVTGVEGSSTQTEDASARNQAQQNIVGTEARRAFARVDWQIGQVGLQAGATAQSADIDWRSRQSHSSTYNSVNPRVQVNLSPWDGAIWISSIEQEVSPYDTAAFIDYATAVQPASDGSFAPDHAWRFQSQLRQNLGPVNATVSYSSDRNGTTTEFAQASNGRQVPASATLVDRSKVDVQLSLPLTQLGMPNTSFSSDAAWQDSRVIDPITSEERRASGEAPDNVSLRLTHSIPSRHLSLGLTGQVSGGRSSYQVSEISTVPSAATVGAFVSFTPGPYEVDLNVNGIGGAPTTDYFFSGTRADSAVTHTIQQQAAGPAISLSLHKAF